MLRALSAVSAHWTANGRVLRCNFATPFPPHNSHQGLEASLSVSNNVAICCPERTATDPSRSSRLGASSPLLGNLDCANVEFSRLECASSRWTANAAKGNVRFGLTLCLVMTLSAPAFSGGAAKDSGAPWIVAASIIRNGGSSGSGVYLKSGLIITAAHLTDADANMGVHIAGVALPASVVKQGSLEDVDLSLLSVDQDKLPARIRPLQMQLCRAPPWPADPVIVVDAGKATRSHIIAPQVLPYAIRSKFSTLIADVATTGNSGSGVFDPNRKCLLGIMSRKFTVGTAGDQRDIAKYFVPATEIREFIPVELRS
jgi:hypothetical protein